MEQSTCELKVTSLKTSSVGLPLQREIVEMCNQAFPAPFDELFSFLPPEGVNIIGRTADGRLVSHAVMSTRDFYLDGGVKLRAAYIDAVATLPAAQRRGFGSLIMKKTVRLAAREHDIAGLSTFIPFWYEKLGWEEWCGELAILEDGQITPTLDEKSAIMIHRLPGTPPLDLHSRLVAGWRPGGEW